MIATGGPGSLTEIPMLDSRTTTKRSVLRRMLMGAVLLAASTQVACEPESLVASIGSAPTDLVITLDPAMTGQLTTPAQLDMEVGQSTTLLATALDALGRPVSSASITWASTDEAVATVDASGQVTAVGAGSAEIVATSNQLFDTMPAAVTVPPGPPATP